MFAVDFQLYDYISVVIVTRNSSMATDWVSIKFRLRFSVTADFVRLINYYIIIIIIIIACELEVLYVWSV